MTPPMGSNRRRGAGDGGRRPGARVVVSAMVILLLARPGRAEDDVVMEPTAATGDQGMWRVDFDAQMAGMLGGMRNGAAEPEAFRTRAIEARLLEVDRIDRICRLDEAQSSACTAAARLAGTLASEAFGRFHRKYTGRVLEVSGPEGQLEWQRFHREFSAVQASLQGKPGDPSLLSRVVERSLDGRQRAAWEEEARRRSQRQWRIVVDKAVAQLETDLGLTARQCDAFEAALMEKPFRYDADKLAEQFGDSEYPLIGCAVWSLAGKRSDGILDERQREAFASKYGNFRALDTMLRQQGMIGD